MDNRVAALRLVQNELCEAALFDPSGAHICPAVVQGRRHIHARNSLDCLRIQRKRRSTPTETGWRVGAGKLLIPQEELYKKNVLLVRGRFRPFTLLHNDMLMGAAQQFFCGPDETSLQEAPEGAADRSAVFDECVYREDSCVILELTTRSMMEVRSPSLAAQGHGSVRLSGCYLGHGCQSSSFQGCPDAVADCCSQFISQSWLSSYCLRRSVLKLLDAETGLEEKEASECDL